jgi:hypothetical protein
LPNIIPIYKKKKIGAAAHRGRLVKQYPPMPLSLSLFLISSVSLSTPLTTVSISHPLSLLSVSALSHPINFSRLGDFGRKLVIVKGQQIAPLVALLGNICTLDLSISKENPRCGNVFNFYRKCLLKALSWAQCFLNFTFLLLFLEIASFQSDPLVMGI